MTKADLVQKVSEKTGFIKEDIAGIVDSFLDSIKEAIIDGERIEIRGFASMGVKVKKASVGRNPRTGETVKIPERNVPVFKYSKEIKTLVSEK